MKVIYENQVKAAGASVEEFKITCVGHEAPVTLKGLGHCTINFSGATEAELPGTIYVEAKPMPEVKIGTTLQIVEK